MAGCRREDIPVFVVSHKMQKYTYDDTGTDYRQAALDWMQGKGFFDPAVGLSSGDVHFEDTRPKKVTRINELGCTHFIDDLEETFLEAGFPAQTEKILFARHDETSDAHSVTAVKSWHEITERLLHAVH